MGCPEVRHRRFRGRRGRSAGLRVASLALLCAAVAFHGACRPSDSGWERASPESQGLVPDAFARWAEAVEERETRSLLVVRNDRLVHEWHAWGHGRESRQHTASLVKSVVGGLALALLAAEGRLDLDDAASRYAPHWRDDPVRSRITLRQLASHSSGLADASEPGRTRGELTGWKALFWKRDPQRTPVQVALEDAPLLFPPGRGFEYSSPGFAVLSAVIAAALRESAEETLPSFLRERLFLPIGVSDREWSIGYGQPFEVDGLEVWATWGGGEMSPGALAKVGRLLLRRGDWEGRRLLPSHLIEEMVTRGESAVKPAERWPAPAVGWWTNANGTWPKLPRDAFLAFGAGHRLLLVVPSLDLVVVRLGASLDPDAGREELWKPLGEILLEPLMDALPRPPVPRSQALAGAWFDPPSSIVCKAKGSDNWPITWRPDGSLFASYGDGWGFAPRTDRKLSLGFASITGTPPDFGGVNVRAPSGERTGDGPRGGKASGLLSVDGVLYMWVRNLDNSQLAWSHDGGRTWEWGFRFQESFGSPTFLNFGPDYAGARDGFVYVYSQDGPSAYHADDRMVLARVPRERIRERDAYQFFAGLSRSGRPRWTSQLGERQGTLEYRGSCRRSEVVFDRALDRYLMALGFDARGGWGIFEAQEPWGPWRTVYFTPRWDVGDTHSYRLPTAWIGDHGRSLRLVFSGRDQKERILDGFCVRGLRILPLENGSKEASSSR